MYANCVGLSLPLKRSLAARFVDMHAAPERLISTTRTRARKTSKSPRTPNAGIGSGWKCYSAMYGAAVVTVNTMLATNRLDNVGPHFKIGSCAGQNHIF